MTRWTDAGRALVRAAAGPLPLAILGSAAIGAVALARWPIAALGGAAYAALVASRLASAATGAQRGPAQEPTADPQAPARVHRGGTVKPQLAIVIAFLIAAAALVYTTADRKAAAPDTASTADLLHAMSEFKDRMCACKDTACAESVRRDLTAWGEAHENPPKPTRDADIKQLTAINQELSLCVARLLGVAPPLAGHGDSPAGASAGTTVELSFLYSPEKKDWLEIAVAEFHKAHPRIRVRLNAKDSLAAASGILAGTDQPVLWSPADSLVANLLDADWQAKHQTSLFPNTIDDGPQPLLLTPMVFIAWEERARRLVDPSPSTASQLSWTQIRKGVTSPQGWAGIGGQPAWGAVKICHTDPGASNLGVEAIALLAYEHLRITTEMTTEHLRDPALEAFLKDIGRAVQRGESSPGKLLTDMIRQGPSACDIAVVDESLAVSQLPQAQSPWGKLRIYYPAITIWSDHPAVLFYAPWITPAQRTAGARLIEFLRSPAMQRTAPRFGFRPANAAVALTTIDAASPLGKGVPHGVSLELPRAADAPEGAVLRELLTIWSRVVKP